MASIKMVAEEEATGKVKDLYEEIKSQLGIDFVPNLYTIGCCEIERLPTGLRSRVPAKEVRPKTSLCPRLVNLTMPER